MIFFGNDFNPNSFRPLTGIMVLIRFNAYGNLESANWFPSPYGDYGSYHKPL